MPVPYIHIHRVRQRYVGQSGAYPELSAVIGPVVPDYRGLFLRGLGGQSAAINVHQKYSTHISSDEARAIMGGSLQQIAGRQIGWNLGSMEDHNMISTEIGYYGFVTGTFENPMSFVNSGATTQQIPISIIGTGTETRPDNKAVRYFIRARP